MGFLSALVGTVGPLVAPFFLAYGLVKGAYIGSEALTALTMHGVKLVVYGRAALLTPATVGDELTIGVLMVAGTFIGKRLLDRMPERIFVAVIDATLVVSGLMLLLLG